MGGSKKQTVGYSYDAGFLFVLGGVNPMDAVNAIEVDGREAWVGPAGPGRARVDKPDLFGGRKREGGVQGDIDFQDGGPTQGANDYLAAATGEAQPGYRGVSSAVLRRVRIGNNPYLKPWAFRAQFIFKTETGYNGGVQWYPERAAIEQRRVVPKVRRSRIYIALDVSLSMDTLASNGLSRLANMKTAVIAYLNQKRTEGAASRSNSIRIVAWANTVQGTITRENARSADYDALISFVANLTTASGTNFAAAVADAPAFFAVSQAAFGNTLLNRTAPQSDERRQLLFLTDGEPTSGLSAAVATVGSLNRVDVYAFNIDLADTSATAQLDNTPADGVPVISGGDPEALTEALNPGLVEYDINPAHILRQVVMRRGPGEYISNSEMAPGWVAAADRLYDERFGLTVSWKTPSKRAEFIERLEAIIDARVYFDRRSGQWDIKLIRDDYDVEDLPVFDATNVVKWTGFERPEPHAVPNTVTVTWTDPAKAGPASLTLTDSALRLQAGGTISAKRDYPEIHRADLAARVAERDLRTLSGRLREGTIVVTHAPQDVTVGSPILLSRPKLGIVDMVARVLERTDGDGRDNSVTLRVIEDKFALPDAATVSVDVIAVPARPVLSPAPRMVQEAWYYELVRALGQESVDALLAGDEALGYLIAAAGRAQTTDLEAILNADAGAGYQDQGTVQFAPAVTVWSNLSRRADHTRLIIADAPELLDVEAGSLALIGGEMVRVDNLFPGGTWAPGDYWAPPVAPVGPVVTLDVGRGVLDTPPEAHAAGGTILFFGERTTVPEVRFTDGETINVKLQTVTPRQTQDIAAAEVDEVAFASRAIRPLPPGNVRVDGDYENGAPWTSGVRTFTWAHRHRLSQTTTVVDDHAAGDIGPEPGTTYSVRVAALDDSGAVLAELFADTGLTGTTVVIDADADFTAPLPAGYAAVVFEVWSVRDGYDSWRRVRIEFRSSEFLREAGNYDELVTDLREIGGEPGALRIVTE